MMTGLVTILGEREIWGQHDRMRRERLVQHRIDDARETLCSEMETLCGGKILSY